MGPSRYVWNKREGSRRDMTFPARHYDKALGSFLSRTLRLVSADIISQKQNMSKNTWTQLWKCSIQSKKKKKRCILWSMIKRIKQWGILWLIILVHAAFQLLALHRWMFKVSSRRMTVNQNPQKITQIIPRIFYLNPRVKRRKVYIIKRHFFKSLHPIPSPLHKTFPHASALFKLSSLLQTTKSKAPFIIQDGKPRCQAYRQGN